MKQILTNNSTILNNAFKSYLSKKATKGDSEIKVDNIDGFGTNKILLIGEFGNEKTEIVHTHSTTSPSGNTVTLDGGLKNSHSPGKTVYIIDWDRIKILHAETEEGSKTELAEIAIQTDREDTVYTDSNQTDGFYFTRFVNSIDNSLSIYSDPLPHKGYSSKRVGSIITYALKRNRLKNFTEFIDYDFCIEEINSCLKYISGKLKKWHRLQDFDYEMGTLERGEYSLDMPNHVWKYSFKSVLDVRVEGGRSLEYVDKKEWNNMMRGALIKQVESNANQGDNEIELNNTVDMREEGGVMINGMLIDYEEIDGNTLKGIPSSGTGSIKRDIKKGDNVWQGHYKESLPEYYTIFGGKMYFWPMTSASRPKINIIGDFWKEAPEVDSDYDEIDILRYDMVKHWLVWAVRMEAHNDGIRDMNDGDYQQFEIMLNDAIRREIHGQKYKSGPKLNKIKYKSI